MVAFGFTVITGTPAVTAEVTVKDAAKTDWVATTAWPEAASPASTSTASVIRPESSRSASLAPISLPSALAVSSTAASWSRSPICPAICCSASTFGTTRCSRTCGSGTRYTSAAPYSASTGTAWLAAGPNTTAAGVPIRRASVSSSSVGLGAEPSTASTTTRTAGMSLLLAGPGSGEGAADRG